MAKRIRAKLVLELLARGMSGREIRSTRHISHRSIKLVRDAADRAGVTWDDVAENEVYLLSQRPSEWYQEELRNVFL